MPKIIENVREQLLAEAKRQISDKGYAKTTIRSVAAACSLGIGTVYNYFPSKDMLIASFMTEDWKTCLSVLNTEGTAEEILRGIYLALCDFSKSHSKLFSDRDAKNVFAAVFSEWHPVLRGQIAEIILPLCKNSENPLFLSDFIAESLLSWTMESKSFDEQYNVLKKLL